MALTKARKVTVSVRSDLVDLVDTYVKGHKKADLSRSAIMEEALVLWGQKLQDEQDELYFKKNATQLNADSKSWLSITTESARRNWE